MSGDLLLHACCAPCSIFPSAFLRGKGRDFTLYFFNPNIQPYREFKRRLAALREFAAAGGIKLAVDKSYPLEDFLVCALREPIIRCHYCYKLRMRKTAEFAANNGYGAFSATLLGSPYQRHDEIAGFARAAAAEFGVSFEYYDFRPGFCEGEKTSRACGMYRQSYCGCVFSERDRYEKKRKK
ncbi:MAG: epoxyqueuosine reductase QueH [Acidaminococcales bacterium]|jgi:predicted adenine nucleotide alpha hydrolase (AANH) superfamily ATPase|nr:epoxyqueuosine reductase QueH [Acidaminococcales bacterium]